MKLFTILLLIPVFSLAQSKGDTKIIVTPTDTTGIFGRVVSALYEKGYNLEKRDDLGGLILTDAREMPKHSPNYKIRALVRDGRVIFSSTIQIKVFGDGFSDVEYTKNKSLYRIVWDMVNEIAGSLGDVKYGR